MRCAKCGHEFVATYETPSETSEPAPPAPPQPVPRVADSAPKSAPPVKMDPLPTGDIGIGQHLARFGVVCGTILAGLIVGYVLCQQLFISPR